MLRLEAQSKCLLELEARRGNTASGKAHEEARSNDRAFADRLDGAFGDIASMQVNLAVEVSGHAKLPIGGDRGSQAPRLPATATPRYELERRDHGERISCRFFAPEENRYCGARLHSSERGAVRVE